MRLEKIAAACDERVTPSIEPSYETGQKQVKMTISPIAQGFLKIFRVQHVALTTRRPKHPCLVWCTVELTGTELAHQTRAAVSRGIS